MYAMHYHLLLVAVVTRLTNFFADCNVPSVFILSPRTSDKFHTIEDRMKLPVLCFQRKINQITVPGT